MQATARIDRAMKKALNSLTDSNTPPRLAECLDYVLFPGGSKVRPRLVIAIADACGSSSYELADAAAVAVEMLHCASLIQDDMQCFDAADIRRGRASVHSAYGPALAILASDALIVGSFDVLSQSNQNPRSSLALVQCLARHTGSRGGITAGQAWEQEPSVDVEAYHAAKTGSLFQAAAELGAICAGADPRRWMSTGRLIGAAYQVADDLADALNSTFVGGKPAGVDAALGRPSIVLDQGVEAATERLHGLIQEVIETLPDCPNQGMLKELIRNEAVRFVPKEAGRSAA